MRIPRTAADRSVDSGLKWSPVVHRSSAVSPKPFTHARAAPLETPSKGTNQALDPVWLRRNKTLALFSFNAVKGLEGLATKMNVLNGSNVRKALDIDLQLREKNDRIRELEEENRRLNRKLNENTREFVERINELVQESERHIITVEKLQNQLVDYEEMKNELRELRSSYLSDRYQFQKTQLGQLFGPATADDVYAALGSFLEQTRSMAEKNSEEVNAEVAASLARLGDFGASNGVPDEPVNGTDKGPSSPKTVDNSDKDEDDMSGLSSSDILSLIMNAGNNQSQTPSSSSSTKGKTSVTMEKKASPPEPKPLVFQNTDADRSPSETRIINALQLRVAENVRSLGGRALNTAETANHCKRLMVGYNIGQRLFAKYVMNQSQGSLSELLSKPRHWNKLTEKGREAFRRIYAWISDPQAIELLCSLSPRKVVTPGVKIEHPEPASLWDNGIPIEPMLNIDTIKTEESSLKPHTKESTPSISPSTSRSTFTTAAKSNRWRHDDIPKEKIMHIFQSELAKLKEQESNLEKALAAPVGSGSAESTPHPEKRPVACPLGTVVSDSIRRLEQMAELSSSPSTSALSMLSFGASKPRTDLPAVTDEQFEKYPYLNTELVVKEVKEYLQSNCISQRRFGEQVLGLSQGSVSDLLGRPKSWASLTQKGREPFIRMKLFLDDSVQMQQFASAAEVDESDLPPGGITEINADTPTKSTTEQLLAQITDIKPDLSDDGVLETDGDEIDIYEVVKRVKNVLQSRQISQRAIGEYVLQTNRQSTVSALLSRPVPWKMLTPKSRRPYIILNEWLKDPSGIDDLKKKSDELVAQDVEMLKNQEVQPEPKEPEKSGATVAAAATTNKRKAGAQSSEDGDSDEVPKKVVRTVINQKQKEALLMVYQHDQHPSAKMIEQLADKLKLSSRTVTNWFHNHRTRQKARERQGKVAEKIQEKLSSNENNNDNEGFYRELSEMIQIAIAQANITNNGASTVTAPTMVSVDVTKTSDSLNGSVFDGLDAEVADDPPPEDSESQLDKAIARLAKMAKSVNKVN
uniref:Homeobox protein cut-like n=1 Tax=Steinernema glaseri TaxID=37863 RepID=A0A1I7YVQ2_9BILA